MFPLLRNLQKNKFKHEEIARKKILDKIDNDFVRKAFQQGGLQGEHRICVFGRSNVGKTTLILKLLGVKSPENDPEHNILNLGRALRGNNDKHGAGTATVTRYSIGPKMDIGFIRYPRSNEEKEFSSLEELEKLLQEVRNKVEAQAWHSTDPMVIKLPQKFFNQEKNSSKWTITDIPGIESKAISEHQHVSDLLQAWVLTSNVLLVMESISKVSRLKGLIIPGFGSWNYFGRRVRLIITRAFADESVREHYKSLSSDAINNQKILDYYKQKILKENINLDGINSVYPLDYGETWQNLKNNCEELYDKINPSMKNFFKHLRKSLNDSLDPAEEFKCLMDIGNIERAIEKQIDDIKEVISGHKEELNNLENQIQKGGNRIKNREEQVEKKKREKKRWLSKREKLFEPPSTPNNYYKESTYSYNDAEKVLEIQFKEAIEVYSNKIFKDKYYINSELSLPFSGFKNWRQYCIPKWRYWKGSYSNWFRSGNWLGRVQEHHRNAYKKMVKEEYEYWTEEINNIVRSLIDDKVEHIGEDIARIKNDISNIESIIGGYREKKEMLEKEINGKKKELKKSKKGKNISSSSLFREEYPKIRAEEIKNLANEQFSEMEKEDEPEKNLQRFAFIYQITNLSKTID